MSPKPPNIIIYCCNSNKFEAVSRILSGSIGQSRYTVYPMDEKEPWQRHCSLAIVASHPHDVPFNTMSKIRQYNRSGGKVLSFGGYFTSLLPLDAFREPAGPCLDELCTAPSHLSIGQGVSNSVVVIPVPASNESKTLKQALENLNINCSNIAKIELKPLTVFSRNTTSLDQFFSLLKTKLTSDNEGNLLLPVTSDIQNRVKLLKDKAENSTFFEDLASDFPEVFISSEVVTSTQQLLWENELLSSAANSVAILADFQMSGKGRGKNQWISPAGSLALSISFSFTEKSILTTKLAFVQYIVALATVNAINEFFESDLAIGIKWPNDIYTLDGTKIGGVLVNCSSNGSVTKLCIGVGLNVNNSEPTTSIAKISGTKLVKAKLASRICNNLFDEVAKFNELGHSQFVDSFCEKWLHKSAKVRIDVGTTNCVAEITSIDSDGFLSVRNIANGKLISVQPDGNSFDMMENLIAVKRS